jgi:small conductance mechanosensitive channel
MSALLTLASWMVTLQAAPAEAETDPLADLQLVQQWIAKGQQWLIDHGPAVLVKAALFVLILIAFKIVSVIAGRMVKAAVSSSRLKWSDLLKNFVVNIVTKSIVVLGILLALAAVDAPIGPILASIGILGFVIGFALQETLGNFAAGVMLLLYRPYDVGDVINAAGVTGTVTSMSLVSTTLLSPDNQLLVVPNNKIWGNVITNVTGMSTRRVDLKVGVSYGDDLKRAEQVLTEIVTRNPRVLKDPTPVVRVHNLGEYAVEFVVRPWCKTADYWDVYWELTREIKQAFDREGITIPLPQRQVRVIGKPEEAARIA